MRSRSRIGGAASIGRSRNIRAQISHSTIDIDKAQIGNEVIVHWGDFGHRIKPIRATVERFPYLDLPTNRDYDLNKIPSGVAKKV